MPRDATRSIASAGSESIGSHRQRSSSTRGERSASNPASFSAEASNYDTALPPINFQTQPPLAHRRTGSTLKTVMRKIFNRKRQSQTDGLEENPHESFYDTQTARQSGPTGEGKSFLAVPTPSDSKRSSPLSVENLHLANNHLSPTTAGPGSMASSGMPSRRRRATLPSVIFSDDESRYGVASSAISDPQEDRPHMPDQERRINMLHARRRSRSTDALHRLANEQHDSPSPWPARTTSAPGSKSSPFEESSVSGQSGRPSTGTTVTSVTRGSAEPSIPESDQHAEQVSLPPNVGNLVNTMQQDDSVTLEQRLTTLEVKMIDLEFAIARMQSSPSDTAPPGRSSRQKHVPSFDSFSPHIRAKPSAFLGAADRDESPSPLANPLPNRPTSTSTIRPETMTSRSLRPAPSSASLSDLHGVSIEQYSALVMLLRREQTARRNLETQVSGLRDDIRQIQRAALHSMELGTMYPIHTVESQEFLRFRRALDDDDSSSPIRGDEKPHAHAGFDSDSDWERSDSNLREDPFGPAKWERGQRIVTAPMI